MFLLTVNIIKYLWGNKRNDDFLQFLPSYFNVEKENILVQLVPEACDNWESELNFLDFSTNGFVTKKKNIPGDPPTVETIGQPFALMTLASWPYDENGLFLGNQFA